MESAAGPLAHGFVLFVSGVAPGFEELGVAGGSTDVFGRAVAGAIDAGRVFKCIGSDLVGQASDLGVRLRVSDRSDQQATATGWFC